jgi:UPF0042 nucleotide-binding protein
VQNQSQRVIIVSGLSGAGKSTALNALEDLGYYCIDNLPAALLEDFRPQIQTHSGLYQKVALGIDARAHGAGLDQVPAWLERAKKGGLKCELLFVTADRSTLIQRFSETRRRHPLTQGEHALGEAIKEEMSILEPLRECADWVLDSSATNIHQLRRQVWKCVGPGEKGMTIVLESFAFKHGVPQDVDFVFDTRNLPNPYWQKALREHNGRENRVRIWLEQDPSVERMSADIIKFLQDWLPGFEDAQRSYVTIGVGCTGGQHRSVYMVERLAAALREKFPEVLIHHRELKK